MLLEEKLLSRGDGAMELIRCSICGNDHPLEESEAAYDRRFHVRALVPIPLQGTGEVYCWGVWAEVDAETFRELVNTWDAPDQESLPRLPGAIANEIPFYGSTRGISVEIERCSDTRPHLHVTGDNPLSREQRQGVPMPKVAEYVHSVGGGASCS